VLLPNVKVCPDGGSCGIDMAVALALGLGLLDCKGVGSVATARLGPLAARLRHLSRFCGSGSQAEPITTTPGRL
jgi:hypothetical protein